MLKYRDYVFDNLKALLIILVVFGHIIEYFGLCGIFLKIKGIIYVFHMPFFIFISGYFSKNIEKSENKAIKNILIPFFIFNTIYMIMTNNNIINYEKAISINIFKAMYLYWYLLSLFFWKMLTKYVTKLKFPILLLFLVNLYIGLIDEANRFLSISRTIAFFPFFMLGYYIHEEHIEKIRKVSKKIIIPLLIILLTITFILSNNIINVELFKNAQSYHISGVRNLKGMAVRCFQFIVAIGISICLINLISANNNLMSKIGQKTITIYILSPYVQEISGLIVRKTILINFMYNDIVAIIVCSIITGIIVFICSLDIVYNTYNKFIDWIYKKITIEDKLELSDK